MATLFFLVSGEHPTLPFSELKAILDAESYEYHVLEKLSQVLRLKANIKCVRVVASRSALTRVCGLELFNCHANFAEIVGKMRCAPFGNILKADESFAVRVRRVKNASPHLVCMELERKLGELILYKVGKARVDLTSPEKTFFGVLTQNRFIFGLKTAEILPKPFMERSPQKHPFFHPSAMPAKLARCMVNLAQPKTGDLVIDPFCGTGSMLVEAGLMGCRVIGLDVQRRMVRGSLRNLSKYGVKPDGMIVADARHLPISAVDHVVTDPPYGRCATTFGLSVQQIIRDAFISVKDKLRKEGQICMSAPKTAEISKIAEELGFKQLESHLVYVHRSLTREIGVFKRLDK
ncbi:MAG: DNA methyltransferase [Thermoproteota archaeon]|nr:DNA methyltransferase [Thermoproteota archaeon]